MKKTYETPQIIVTAFEGENTMVTVSNLAADKVKRTTANTIDF